MPALAAVAMGFLWPRISSFTVCLGGGEQAASALKRVVEESERRLRDEMQSFFDALA